MHPSVRGLRLFACCFVLLLLLIACQQKDDNYTPKPRGYFRIDLPQHEYQTLDTTLPFAFEQSAHAQTSFQWKKDGSCWMDVLYPELNATFKFTYFPIKNADSLRNLIVQEERMMKFHFQKADDVEYSTIRDQETPLWGQIYDIEGKEVATPLQFWMTDSAHHFLRATLYFNFTPNNDSLQPVIEYLRDDALHLVNTFAWK